MDLTSQKEFRLSAARFAAQALVYEHLQEGLVADAFALGDLAAC